VRVEEARAVVISRDGGCVAPLLDPGAGRCHDRWGNEMPRRSRQSALDLEVDRIRDAPAMGKAPGHDDPSRMVALCPGHHRGVGPSGGVQWATSHRAEIREYLARHNGRSEERDGVHGDPLGSVDDG